MDFEQVYYDNVLVYQQRPFSRPLTSLRVDFGDLRKSVAKNLVPNNRSNFEKSTPRSLPNYYRRVLLEDARYGSGEKDSSNETMLAVSNSISWLGGLPW